jgi:hypothetical protein
MARHLSGLALALVVLCMRSRAAADEPRWEPGRRTTSTVRGEVGEPDGGSGDADGVYGRFEGDLDLGLGLGVEADGDDARGAARLSLHYFSTLGLTVEYADSLQNGTARSRRLFGVGVDVRPAFIPRWSGDHEHGPAFVDLTLDSISLGVGAFWAEPPGRDFGDARGLEASLGLGLPLFGRADGLWLEGRVLGRWRDPAHAPGERADAVALAVLSWHTLILSPLAARGTPLSE